MNARPEAVLFNLEAAARSGIPEQVEDAVYSAYEAGLISEFLPPLILLLSQDWHVRHEDIVGALQNLRDARAIKILLETAAKKFPYLEFDECRALARKCTWALADIGTAEAKEALWHLATSSDQLVSSFAQKRLDGWNNELHRKNKDQDSKSNPATSAPTSLPSPNAMSSDPSRTHTRSFYPITATVALVMSFTLAPTPDIVSPGLASLLTVPTSLLFGFLSHRFGKLSHSSNKITTLVAIIAGIIGSALSLMIIRSISA